MAVKFNGKYLDGFVKDAEFANIFPQVELAHKVLHEKTGAGNDFLGWLDLPFTYDKEEFARIKKSAEKIRNDSDVLVVIGIGGSYLGARAAIEFLGSMQYNDLNDLKVYFVGNNISPEREADVLRMRFGMYDGRTHTLEEVGQNFGVTRERIRQIENKAIRKLRHPSRAKKIKDFYS